MPDTVLEATGIRKSFNGVQVLGGVNFRLCAGEVHAIVGQNGAGKSTLMKILSGAYRRDAGEILVAGKRATYTSVTEASRSGIRMVYQDFSLVPSMTVYQNIFLGSQPQGRSLFLDEKAMRSASERILTQIGVDVAIDPATRVGDLSVGSKQIVEIAKALSGDSRILIFDEPTASLSPGEIASLFAVIARLKAQGIAIVYITHYLKDVFRICDAVTVLRDGMVVTSGPTSQMSLESVISAMTGKQASAAHRRGGDPARKAIPLLAVHHLHTAKVRDISFTLHAGEILGLAGLLGSGRTELLRALYGLDPVTTGGISVAGKPLSIRNPAQARMSGLALIPEDRRQQGLLMDFPVFGNLVVSLLGSLGRGPFVDARKGRELTQSYVSRFSIKVRNALLDPVRYLSGGNQQKVVIAKNIADNPRILLLDDPTFGIDIQSKTEIMEIVREYVAKGNGAIFVSSEFGELASICDRILIMKKGALASDFAVGDSALSEEDILHMAQ